MLELCSSGSQTMAASRLSILGAIPISHYGDFTAKSPSSRVRGCPSLIDQCRRADTSTSETKFS